MLLYQIILLSLATLDLQSVLKVLDNMNWVCTERMRTSTEADVRQGSATSLGTLTTATHLWFNSSVRQRMYAISGLDESLQPYLLK